jgi:RNA polymerase primary sigma factor
LDDIGQYLKEIARTPLLTSEQEVELCKRLERGVLAQKKIDNLNGSTAPYTLAELLDEVEDGRGARDHLIKANTRLVVSIAKKYIGRGVPFLDLIQEGNLGLMKAVGKFDHHRGFRLSTYATWWIRQVITRNIADASRTIRIPVHASDQVRKIYNTIKTLTQELRRDPSDEEIADKLGVSANIIRRLINANKIPLSLDEPIPANGFRGKETELIEFMEDRTTPSPSQTAQENQLKQRIEAILDTLTPKEAKIIRVRFGLVDGEAHTLEEVGKMFGLTRERIRQIEGVALRRLRHPRRSRALRDFI